jgi:hypothetical protein
MLQRWLIWVAVGAPTKIDGKDGDAANEGAFRTQAAINSGEYKRMIAPLVRYPQVSAGRDKVQLPLTYPMSAKPHRECEPPMSDFHPSKTFRTTHVWPGRIQARA